MHVLCTMMYYALHILELSYDRWYSNENFCVERFQQENIPSQMQDFVCIL